MNCFWPVSAPLRSSCRNTSSLFQIRESREILIALKFVQPSIRPYSIFSIPCRRRDVPTCSAKVVEGRFQRQSIRFVSTSRNRSRPPDKVVTQFEILPRGYKDKVGLPFRATDLKRQEVVKIFGEEVENANHLLRVIHGRRVAGTLEDPNLPDMAAIYGLEACDLGLQWLRRNVPVDEVANAGLRAEQELAEMDRQVLSDAEKMGIYKPNSEDRSESPGGVYGKGAFDRIREENKRIAAEEEARKKAQAEEIMENIGPLANINHNTGSKSLQTPTSNPRLLYYKEQAQILSDKVAPEMSAFSRIWPSSVLLLITLSGCYLFAQVYEPPQRSTRLWPDIPSSAATVISLIMLNAAIFCAWRIPPFWRTMNKYFIQVPAYPYAVSLIGNIFSHQTLTHLGLNMLVIYLFGTRLHEEIGRGQFLALYVAAGAFGSFVSLSARLLSRSLITSSLGASGALCGLIGCYLLLHSEEKVTIFGVFPPEDWPSISSLMLLALLVGADVFGLVRKRHKGTGIDYMAHLGGYALGIGSALMIREEVKRRKAREAERKRRNRTVIDKITERRF